MVERLDISCYICLASFVHLGWSVKQFGSPLIDKADIFRAYIELIEQDFFPCFGCCWGFFKIFQPPHKVQMVLVLVAEACNCL